MSIRFYTQNGDWLSIGKNQKEPMGKTWIELLKYEQLKIVRRPSGGKLFFIAEDLLMLLYGNIHI